MGPCGSWEAETSADCAAGTTPDRLLSPDARQFVEVMSRDKFAEVGRSGLASFLSILVRRTTIVSVKHTRRLIAQDPEDDMVLSTALKGNASYIVSGDEHLLDLKRFKGVKIVTVDEMLETLGPRTAAS